MSRITKINFTGFALTVAILTTSLALGALGAGCGPKGSSMRPAKPSEAPGTAKPAFSRPTTSAMTVSSVGVNDIAGFNQSQLRGLLTEGGGYYSGTLAVFDNGDLRQQMYTVRLRPVSEPSAPGKVFIQADFQSGNIAFQSLMQVHMMAPVWGATGPTYFFTSPVKHDMFIYPESSGFIFQLGLTVNSANQFDPTQSPIINIVDGVLLEAVVGFYDDFQKH
jgi:hypothetical protein